MNNIQIKTKTWIKESYGLFDYEATDVVKQSISLNKDGIIGREGNKVVTICDHSNYFLNNTDDYLFSIFLSPSGKAQISDKIQGQIWKALTSRLGVEIKNHQILKENDFFKLGKIKFQVLKIKSQQEKKNGHYYDSIIHSLKNYYKKEVCEYKRNTYETEPGTLGERASLTDFYQKKLCRFCLSDTIIYENPLLNICKCDGSLKYVHLLCIQSWLTSKLHLKQNNGVLNVLWQGLVCELCKTPLPLQFETDEGGVHELIDFKLIPNEITDENPSMILQSFTKHNTPSGLHFVKLNGKSFIKIGRGNECEIKLSDISVSRYHASINLDDGKFFLKDNSSKFGTLVLYQEPLSISSSHLILQFGRTLVEIFKKKKTWFHFSCFGCEQKSSNNFEEEKKDDNY